MPRFGTVTYQPGCLNGGRPRAPVVRRDGWQPGMGGGRDGWQPIVRDLARRRRFSSFSVLGYWLDAIGEAGVGRSLPLVAQTAELGIRHDDGHQRAEVTLLGLDERVEGGAFADRVPKRVIEKQRSFLESERLG